MKVLNKKRIFILIISFSFVCIICVGALYVNYRSGLTLKYSNIYPQFSLTSMLGDTDYIVSGSVVDMKMYKKVLFDFDIHNDVYFEIEKCYNGFLKPGDIIKIEYYKSEDGSVQSDDDMVFSIGESLLLFLNKSINATSCEDIHYIVKGDTQGKFVKTGSSVYTSEYYQESLTINTDFIEKDILLAQKKLVENPG